MSDTISKALNNKNSWIWFVVTLFAINVVTTELYTTVWMDEVMFTQPAANEHLGLGFTSTAWAFQDKDAFWAGNAPLYSLMLCGWYKVFGFGIYQTRILDYLLWSLAVIIFCMAVRRFGWITESKWLSLLALLSFLGHGATFAYRSGRYEPLAVLLVSICFLAFSIQQIQWRCLVIFAVCAWFLPACLALGPFFVMIGALLLLVSRGKYWKELFAGGFGIAVGLGLLFLFFNHFGVWKDFWNATTHGNSQTYYDREAYQGIHVGLITILKRKAADIFKVFFQDESSIVLLLTAIVALIFRRKELRINNRLLIFIALAFVAVPLGMLLAYAFPIYYWWMRYLPACLAFVFILKNSELPQHRLFRRTLIVGVLLVTSMFGLPGRIALAAVNAKSHDYSKVEVLVNKAIKPGDVVFGDFQAYYPLERLKVRTYYSWYLDWRMSPDEAASINCLVIIPSWLPYLKDKLGGEWQSTGEVLPNNKKFGVHFLDRLLPNYLKKNVNMKYDLAVYRRIPKKSTTSQ